MRIPFKNVYRAFPELDRFSDVQCRLLMRRVQLNYVSRVLVALVPVVAFLVSLAVVIILLATTDVRAAAGRLVTDGDLWLSHLALAGIPPFVGLLTRDRLLRRFLLRAIRLRIDRVRCRYCRYILIGQQPFENRVTCPECGGSNPLPVLGITADDLIPPASEVEHLSIEARLCGLNR
jgi:hypothetical protein